MIRKLPSLELRCQVIHSCVVSVLLQIRFKIDSSNCFLKMKAAISKVTTSKLNP